MPRVELFDRDEVLEKALNLFWNKGYESTSLSDLTKELGIGKGSFYNAFGSKRTLFDNCLSIYCQRGHAALDQMLKEYKNPMDGIRNLLTVHVKSMLDDAQSKGCLIANSTAEMARDMEMQRVLLENNRIVKSKIVGYLSKGHLARNAEGIADALLIHITGISVMSKFMKEEERLRAANEQFLLSLHYWERLGCD